MKKSFRQVLLLIISLLSLFMSAYICLKVNIEIPEMDDSAIAPDPVDVSYQNTDEGIRIEWKPSERTVSYEVSRKNNDGEWEVCTTTGDTWYDDTAVIDGQSYSYRVICNGKNKNSQPSQAVKVLRLSKPVIGTAEKDEGGITLSWLEVKAAEYYYVYRSSDNKSFERISERIRDLTYTDSDVSRGSVYYYYVKASASNNSYMSASSDAVSVEY